MKKITSILLLVLLVNCSTVNTTNNNSEKPNSPIDTIIDAFKNIPIPKM
jgi:hypothetical protein